MDTTVSERANQQAGGLKISLVGILYHSGFGLMAIAITLNQMDIWQLVNI